MRCRGSWIGANRRARLAPGAHPRHQGIEARGHAARRVQIRMITGCIARSLAPRTATAWHSPAMISAMRPERLGDKPVTAGVRSPA